MDKPALRNALKKLRAVPFDRDEVANVMMAPQEMLDFLAMTAGIKPVFLLGRGFDDPHWIEGVLAVARQMGLNIIEGPMWDAAPVDNELPAWFRDRNHGAPQKNVFYISRARAPADAVEASLANPPVAIEEEARLLGYPPCCVRAHYERDALMDRFFFSLLERTAGGDVAEMQRVMREDVQMSVDAPEDQETLRRAREFTPAPFTSFHMCNECAADPSRPAGQISKRYEELARAIDAGLATEVAANQEGVGRYD